MLTHRVGDYWYYIQYADREVWPLFRPARLPLLESPRQMKFWISILVAIVAICVFAWMFRYDVQASIFGPVRLDRWTGEVERFSSDRGWVPYRP